MFDRLATPAALAALIVAGPALGADAKPAPKDAAKPAPKAASATAASGPFDARDPASLAGLLESMNAKSERSRLGDHGVSLKVTAGGFGFGVQYVDCDERGRDCKALAFSTAAETRKATLVQINAFNQTSISCRAFEDQAGKAHVMYSVVLSPNDTREEMRNHVGVWQGCLATFGAFLTDPAGYLASAP